MPTKHLNILALPMFIYENAHLYIYFIIPLLLNWRWLYLAGMAIMLILQSIWEYTTFIYALRADELYIRRGWFFKKEHHIPYDRIQNVQRNQWFFLKPFHIEELIIDTGAKSAKVRNLSLPAVKKQVADRLNQLKATAVVSDDNLAAQRRSSASSSFADARYQIKWADLLIFAITNLNIFVQLGLLYSFFYRFHLDELIGKRVHNLQGQLIHAGMIIIVGLIILLVILMVLVNIAQAVVKYYHFTLLLKKRHLTIEKGFFKRKTINIPLDKIQGIELHQKFLRKLFHLVSVKVDVISDHNSNDDQGALTLIPVINDSLVYQKTHQFIDTVPSTAPVVKKGDWYMMWLFVRNGILVSLPILSGASALIWHFYHGYLLWLILFLLLIPIIINGMYKGYHTGVHQINHHKVILRDAKLMQNKALMIDWHTIQSMRMRQSIWMKKRQRIHLEVMLRSGSGSKRFNCRYLPEEQVRAIFDWYRTFA